MLRIFQRALLLLAVAGAVTGCEPPSSQLEGGLPSLVEATRDRDFELEICQTRIAEVKRAPSLAGAPELDAHRVSVLGRAIGEPMVFVTEPPAPLDPLQPGEQGWSRVARIRRFHALHKPQLRERLLRDGYLYSSDPLEAYALVKDLRLQDLFDEPTLVLQRGSRVYHLEKKPARFERGSEYRFTDGDDKNHTATLMFGDRVATDEAGLAEPLHRDVNGLRARVGFTRMRVTHRASDTLLAELRFGDEWLPALLVADGAALEVACLAVDRAGRERARRWAESTASRRRAIARLQASVDALVRERLPFDRPREAEDHLSDGQLRPRWEWAYKRGAFSFTHDEKGYAVFDADGRPSPPETCVEMVLDSFERASGNWFQPKDGERGRSGGGLSFAAEGVKNRAGVLAFELYAQETPELFTHRRIPEPDRVAFRDRERFFAYLANNADAFEPGDIVAIQGLKRDGNIHQHAILIKDTDPLTGMPFALADQMKRPRNRSWEGIMAEAPLRSLLFHVKPTAKLLAKLDGAPPNSTATASVR